MIDLDATSIAARAPASGPAPANGSDDVPTGSLDSGENAVRARLLAAGIMLALSIAGSGCAMQPAAVAELVIAPLEADATHAGTGTADRGRHRYSASSRRLFGVWLITMSGTVVILRARRRRTF